MHCFTFEHFYYKAHSDFSTFQAVMGFHSFHYDIKNQFAHHSRHNACLMYYDASIDAASEISLCKLKPAETSFNVVPVWTVSHLEWETKS